MKSLNKFYRQCGALWENDFSPNGLDFIDRSDYNKLKLPPLATVYLKLKGKIKLEEE